LGDSFQNVVHERETEYERISTDKIASSLDETKDMLKESQKLRCLN